MGDRAVRVSIAARVADDVNPFVDDFAFDSYDAGEDNEISLREGEHVIEIEETDEAWWTGTTANGQRGLFPGK